VSAITLRSGKELIEKIKDKSVVEEKEQQAQQLAPLPFPSRVAT